MKINRHTNNTIIINIYLTTFSASFFNFNFLTFTTTTYSYNDYIKEGKKGAILFANFSNRFTRKYVL